MIAVTELSDGELLELSRSGDDAAFAELFRRYSPLARRVAAGAIRQPSDQDDAVAAAFTNVWKALCNGRGPKDAFAPYLIVSVRRAAMDISKAAAKTVNFEPEEFVQSEDDTYSVIDSVDSILALRALNTLPSKWQTVLWYVLVEGQSARKTAEILGSNANAVAAMTARAKEGLRKAFSEISMSTNTMSACDVDVRQLMRYSRGFASKSTSSYLDKHIVTCEFCQQREMEIMGVAGTLRGRVRSAAFGLPLLEVLAQRNWLLKLRLVSPFAKGGMGTLVAAVVVATVLLWPGDGRDQEVASDPAVAAEESLPSPHEEPASADATDTPPSAQETVASNPAMSPTPKVSQPSWPRLLPGASGDVEIHVSSLSGPMTVSVALPSSITLVLKDLPPSCSATSQTVVSCAVGGETGAGPQGAVRVLLPVAVDAATGTGTMFDDGRAWLSDAQGAIVAKSQVQIRVETAGEPC